MALEFTKYKMVNGLTRLGERYFNGVFKRLDFRLHELEQRRKSEDVAVDEITRVGLARIDSIIVPITNDLATVIEEGQNSVNALELSISEVAGGVVSTADFNQLSQDLTALIDTKPSQADLDDLTVLIDAKPSQAQLDDLTALIYAGL